MNAREPEHLQAAAMDRREQPWGWIREYRPGNGACCILEVLSWFQSKTNAHLARSVFLLDGHGRVEVGDAVFHLRTWDCVRVPPGLAPVFIPEYRQIMKVLLTVDPDSTTP